MLNKVPQVTLAFWIIKISATTLGETAGDALSMTLNLGYAISTAIFFGLFLASLGAQVYSKSFHPFLYWTVIVTTTTAGTTMSDYLTRTAQLGYLGASLVLFTCVIAILLLWYYTTGSISVNRIKTHKSEVFYWSAILFSNTLGTALGDCLADTSGLGYLGGASVFSAALVLIAFMYFFTKVSHTLLFWMAFILTRPLGATMGDFLTKPFSNGGLNLSRISSSLIILVFMIICIHFTSQKSETVE